MLPTNFRWTVTMETDSTVKKSQLIYLDTAVVVMAMRSFWNLCIISKVNIVKCYNKHTDLIITDANNSIMILLQSLLSNSKIKVISSRAQNGFQSNFSKIFALNNSPYLFVYCYHPTREYFTHMEMFPLMKKAAKLRHILVI